MKYKELFDEFRINYYEDYSKEVGEILERIKIHLTKEYLDIVRPILSNKEYQKRVTYKHHGETSAFEHMINVSLLAYKKAVKMNIKCEIVSLKDSVVGAALHDFYDDDWHSPQEKKKPFFKMHGFTHPREAYNNSLIYFPHLVTNNEIIKAIILSHMIPLCLDLEAWVLFFKHREARFISWCDKRISLEIRKDMRNITMYFGFGKPIVK